MKVSFFTRAKISVFFLMLTCALRAAPTMQELFLRANAAYEQGNVQEALAMYQRITPAGSATWYNRGLCFARLGDAARARACWLQAEHTATIGELRMIAQAIDALDRLHAHSPRSHLMCAARMYAHALPPVLAQLLVLVGLFMLFFCAKWWYYGLHGKSIVLVAGCIILLGAGSMYLQYQDRCGRHGVIVADNATVYSGPDNQFHKQGTLSNASEVAVHRAAGSWYKVTHASITGWVAADAIMVV